MTPKAVAGLLAAALGVLSVVSNAGATDPGNSQLASWAQICAAVGEGELTFSSSTPSQCSSLPNRIVGWSDFTGNFNTSGCGSGNPIPTWAALRACAVNGSTVSADTDPWFIDGSTYWPITGAGTFAADSSGISGEPGGAQAFSSPSAATGTTSIKQEITPVTLNAGTTLVARAYLQIATVSVGGTGSGCTGGSVATASGTAEIEILNSSGSPVESPTTTTSSTFALVATPLVHISSTGTYYVQVVLVTASASGTLVINDPTPSPHCVTTFPTGYANGSAIDVTIANS